MFSPSPRRALILVVFIVLCFFFLYHRDVDSPKPKSKPPTPVTKSKMTMTPDQQSEAIVAESKPKPVPVVRGSSQSQQRLTIERLQKLPLGDQLEYQFPYVVEAKFPAFIWQTWKYTPASPEFDEKFRGPEASWTEKHPTFVHEVITDQVAGHLIRHLYGAVPAVLEAYQALPLNILKADFFRYLILLARGGIYSDIDTSALKPATEWLPDTFKPNQVGLVIGIEADPDRPDWKSWYSRRIQFCQWTIQSKPGHPVLREIIVNITESTLKLKKAGKLHIKPKNVVEFTGPAVWTDIIFEFFNNPKYYDRSEDGHEIDWRVFAGMKRPKQVGDVVVLPITSFSPGVGQMGSMEVGDPQAFVFHNFEGSWKPESERHIVPEADRLKREKEEKEKQEEETKKKAKGQQGKR